MENAGIGSSACISRCFCDASNPPTIRQERSVPRAVGGDHPHHALVRLAGLVPWSHFDEAFGRFYRPIGRPAKPTRLMVGLHYLKHVHDLSDEEVVARWVENPYWQFFCGFEFFQHEVPLDASTMTRWRKRIGPAGLEEMLKASVGVALDTGVAKPSSLERVSVDTTVQPKAIAHPTDSRLYWKALQILVRQAKRHGVALQQSHTRLAKAAMLRAGRHAHARQFRRMRRALKQSRYRASLDGFDAESNGEMRLAAAGLPEKV